MRKQKTGKDRKESPDFIDGMMYERQRILKLLQEMKVKDMFSQSIFMGLPVDKDVFEPFEGMWNSFLSLIKEEIKKDGNNNKSKSKG